MIISPPFLRDRDANQSDADWIESMMPVNARRGYPLNASESWHGASIYHIWIQAQHRRK